MMNLLSRFQILALAVLAACLSGAMAQEAKSDAFYDDDFLEEDLLADERAEPGALDGPDIHDPIEPFNRTMFTLNDGIYQYILEPIADGYSRIVPVPVSTGIGNFFDNLLFPSRFVNNILRGDFDSAGRETGRFLVDTIGGLGGFLRPSRERPELRTVPVDLGLTLGSYGFDHGFYLVLPIFGPSSLRDGIGTAGEVFLSPTHYLSEWEYRAAANGIEFINLSPTVVDAYNAISEAAIDPYVSMRNAYAQRRKAGAEIWVGRAKLERETGEKE